MHKITRIKVADQAVVIPESEQFDSINAILNKIHDALVALNDNREETSIDLREIFRPDQTDVLKDILGASNVGLHLDFAGSTEILATAIHGVWWVTHFDETQSKYCELIEIAYSPKQLVCSNNQTQFGQLKLHAIINRLNNSA